MANPNRQSSLNARPNNPAFRTISHNPLANITERNGWKEGKIAHPLKNALGHVGSPFIKCLQSRRQSYLAGNLSASPRKSCSDKRPSELRENSKSYSHSTTLPFHQCCSGFSSNHTSRLTSATVGRDPTMILTMGILLYAKGIVIMSCSCEGLKITVKPQEFSLANLA